MARRVSLYIVGMILLAWGLALTAETQLGTSPLTSVAFVVASHLNISFSDATLGLFLLYVIAQLSLRHPPNAIFLILLQIPLSILFTRVMGIVQWVVDLTECSLALRLFFLLLSVCLTGVGAAMTLNTGLIPNPGDGFVQAVAEAIHRPLGLTKNILDILSVCIAAGLSLLLLGRVVGVGIGSVVCMLGTGRVIALYQRLTEPTAAKAHF